MGLIWDKCFSERRFEISELSQKPVGLAGVLAISEISEISQRPVGVGWGGCDEPDKRDMLPCRSARIKQGRFLI